MKAYRKKLVGLVLAATFCFSPVSAFAAESSVNITSGLVLNQDEVECTFDESRLLYGEAAPGAKITFTISKLDRFGQRVQVYTDTITVGSMGLFSTTLPLERGNNYITMTVEGEDTSAEVVVKRVPKTVKTQLKRMIALPGQL
ncbi:MAG: hypothetical protein ACI4TP_02635 [Anaerotignum sp.]